MSFVYGLILGFFIGTYVMWRYMKGIKEKHFYHIDPKDLIDLIESDEELEKLKKELHL